MEENLLEKVLKETGYVKIMSEDVSDETTPEFTYKRSVVAWEDPKSGEIHKSPLERACFKPNLIEND